MSPSILYLRWRPPSPLPSPHSAHLFLPISKRCRCKKAQVLIKSLSPLYNMSRARPPFSSLLHFPLPRFHFLPLSLSFFPLLSITFPSPSCRLFCSFPCFWSLLDLSFTVYKPGDPNLTVPWRDPSTIDSRQLSASLTVSKAAPQLFYLLQEVYLFSAEHLRVLNSLHVWIRIHLLFDPCNEGEFSEPRVTSSGR